MSKKPPPRRTAPPVNPLPVEQRPKGPVREIWDRCTVEFAHHGEQTQWYNGFTDPHDPGQEITPQKIASMRDRFGDRFVEGLEPGRYFTVCIDHPVVGSYRTIAGHRIHVRGEPRSKPYKPPRRHRPPPSRGTPAPRSKPPVRTAPPKRKAPPPRK